jgi:membrane-bound lytic murein transglycosylase D
LLVSGIFCLCSGTAIAFNDPHIKEKICAINSAIFCENPDEIAAYVQGYFSNGIPETQELLGRTAQYFPIFEHFLKIYQLPEELKFIPVIESALRPYAVSTAGAAGLWQFTPETGRAKGLLISNSIDERRDPHKSTAAAVRYMAHLYNRFGQWDLALAAYNCGETRLQRAIKQAGTKDFRVLRQFLPLETATYLSRFLAARYMVKYHADYGLSPVFPASDLLMTKIFLTRKALSFNDLEYLTGINRQTLQLLNPAYFNGKIPASDKGNLIVLPQATSSGFELWAAKNQLKKPQAPPAIPHFSTTAWTVQKGDSLEKLARLCGCSSGELKRWNGLGNDDLFLGQKIVLYYPLPTVPSPKA